MNEAGKRGRKPSPEKRQAILDAALDLFGRRGVEASTTREIAEAAETTERTLFKHFGSKERLVQAVIESVVGAFLSEGVFARIKDVREARDLAAWHHDFLAERVASADAMPNTYRILFRELLRDDAFRRRCVDAWMDALFTPLVHALRAMQKRGEIARASSAEALAGAFFSLNLGYLVSRFALAPELPWRSGRDIEATVALFAAACGARAPGPAAAKRPAARIRRPPH